jgi:hypothetical protein
MSSNKNNNNDTQNIKRMHKRQTTVELLETSGSRSGIMERAGGLAWEGRRNSEPPSVPRAAMEALKQGERRPVRTTTPRRSKKYSLMKGLGFWRLTFAGAEAVVKDDRGVNYVAFLLRQRAGEPIHALDMVTRLAAASGEHDGLSELKDPETGNLVALTSDARVQERASGLDEARVMRAVIQRQAELEALVDDESQSEPVREEAYGELEKLYAYEKRNCSRVRDTAAKASDAVGRALKRLEQKLHSAKNPDGTPNLVVQEFGQYVRAQILIPSGRGGWPGGARAALGKGGYFVHEGKKGVEWKW